MLWYFSRADTAFHREQMRNINLKLFEEGKNGNLLKYVKFHIFSDDIANTEMVRGAVEVFKLNFF